jgi:hypothetical protein
MLLLFTVAVVCCCLLIVCLFVRLMWKGFRKSLTVDNLSDLNRIDKSDIIAPKFQKEWDKEVRRAG